MAMDQILPGHESTDAQQEFSLRLEAAAAALLDRANTLRVDLTAVEAEVIYSLERSAAVAWELEDRRRAPVDAGEINEKLRQQAAAFGATLFELHGTFAAADTDVAQRIAQRIRVVLERYGVEVSS